MTDTAEVHPSHYLDVPAELAQLRQQIGHLKTENSTLRSALVELATAWAEGFEAGERFGASRSAPYSPPPNPYRQN